MILKFKFVNNVDYLIRGANPDLSVVFGFYTMKAGGLYLNETIGFYSIEVFCPILTAAACHGFLPVGAMAEVDALMQRGADLLGNGVGGAVQRLNLVSAFIEPVGSTLFTLGIVQANLALLSLNHSVGQVAHGRCSEGLRCRQHVGRRGVVPCQHPVDVEHHHA